MHINAVFLSPHRDDICFSIGILAQNIGGLVLNIFTRSQYSVETVNDFTEETIQRISAERAQEDARFVEVCGLSKIDLGWNECPLRNLEPFGSQKDPIDISRLIRHSIIYTLEFIAKKQNQKIHLFCPMAIRSHIDHELVKSAIFDCWERLEKLFIIHFYEDFPYAANPEYRLSAINKFKKSRHCLNYTYFPFIVDGSEGYKSELVNLYKSQLETSGEEIPLLHAHKGHQCESIWTKDSETLKKLISGCSLKSRFNIKSRSGYLNVDANDGSC